MDQRQKQVNAGPGDGDAGGLGALADEFLTFTDDLGGDVGCVFDSLLGRVWGR